MAQVVLPVSVYTEIKEKKALIEITQPCFLNDEGTKVQQDVKVWIDAMGEYLFEVVSMVKELRFNKMKILQGYLS